MFNVGLRRDIVRAAIMAMRRRLDFVVLCETKLRDASTIRALAQRISPNTHLRVLSSCRPASDSSNSKLKKPASGGILVLVFNPSLTIIDHWDDNRGILSFSARFPDSAPFACVCVYYPDVSSPYSRWTDSLIEASGREFVRRRNMYGNLVFWLGDFNLRLGQYRMWQRLSPDKHAVVTPRVRRLRQIMRTLDVLPIHGRAAHIPAYYTSSSVAPAPGTAPGMAEVDFIVAPAALPPSMFRPIRTPVWGDAELPARSTHLPLFIETDLPAAPGYAPQAPKVRRKRPFCLPPYSDAKWFSIHAHIKRALPQTLHTISQPGCSLDACHAALTSLFRDAAISVCGTHIPRVRTFKQRLFKGVPLPSEIVALFDLARHYRKLRKRTRTPVARKHWEAAADDVKRSATSLADSFLLRFREKLLSNLQHLVRVDPHQVHGFLAHLQAAEASNCADPSTIPAGPDGLSPLENFARACKRIVTETGVCPIGPDSPACNCHVSHANGGAELVRPFTARQIYEFFFPATTRRPLPSPCHQNCRICLQYLREVTRWRPRDPFPLMPVPHHRGSLHTSRGADLDDLVAELIRWSRPKNWRRRWNYRLSICNVLAYFFNEMLQSATVPSGTFAQCVTSPLYKSVKPGTAPPPRWDTEAYRFITNSSLLSKAFSTLLASRLAHWCVRTGLLSEEQVAFKAFRGTEEHVFALQQVLRERARRGLRTYLLFVDFKKAYDTVNLEALWKVLALQGVPLHFIALLRDWAAKRQTRVRVNGELSAPFPMSKGVPQGDPLSCLLFNLFIDSLSRFLKSRPDLPGVSAFSHQIIVQHLLYADDLVGLAESAEELQRLLLYVHQWASDWGMELNTGVGKTEAMVVDADAIAPAQLPPLRLTDGREVRWTLSYRYLGYIVRSDLRGTDAIGHMLAHLAFLWNAHFQQNGLVRHASAAFQMQYYCTMVQGSLRNLRALTQLYAADAEKLETRLRAHIREIFNIRGGTPSELVSSIGAMLPWRAVQAQEQERLYLQLSNSLFPESIAARVFRLAQIDPSIGISLAKRNWVKSWEQQRLTYAAMGVELAAPGLRHELIAAAAKRFGRAVAFVEWQQSGRREVPILAPPDASVMPSYRPSVAAANLFENYCAPVQSLGTHHDFTPLSVHGPGCSGSIPTRSNLPAAQLGPIIWARTGAAAMRSPLFAFGMEPADYAAHARPCTLCGVSPVDPFHLFVECNHRDIAEWRTDMVTSVREFIIHLTHIIYAERYRAGHRGHGFLLRRVRRVTAGMDFYSIEGHFIIYRMLLAHPWSERLASPGMRCVRLLGRVFDLPGIYHRYERPILDAWCRWSRYWLLLLSYAWRISHA